MKKRDPLYNCGLAILLAGFFVYFINMLTGYRLQKLLLPCLFHSLTGFYCPGCGGTRAFLCMLHGEFLKSLHYHPLVLYGTILYLCYMVSNTIELLSRGKIQCGMKYHVRYVWTGILILVLNCIWKNMALLMWGQVL